MRHLLSIGYWPHSYKKQRFQWTLLILSYFKYTWAMAFGWVGLVEPTSRMFESIMCKICSFVSSCWLSFINVIHTTYIHTNTLHTTKHNYTSSHAHAWTQLLQLGLVNVRRGMKMWKPTNLHVHVVCCMIDTWIKFETKTRTHTHTHKISNHTHTTQTQNTKILAHAHTHIHTIHKLARKLQFDCALKIHN